uniref:Hsp70-binding protein 1 n=1 Tax=Alona affinis TaxID=381656 RepID=A0A9N6WSW9_9CRUS|nr:EOG090X0EEI [Alona affinis]
MEPPRQPRDMQALLRFAIEGTAGEDRTTDTATAMSDERRRWLEEALKGLSVDVVAEISKSLTTLNPDRVLSPEEDPQEMEEAMESITDFVDSIDTANDFHKIGGFFILGPCLLSPHDGLRWRCCQLIASITQNNPYCQGHILKEDLLPTLLKMLENDSCVEARIKALYAVSCLTRDCLEAQKALVANDGFSSLLRALQSPVEKLRAKAAFMLKCLCIEDPSHKDSLCDMGFVEQLVALLQREHDSTHEHLMAALLAICEDHPSALAESRRPEFLLKELLENRIDILAGQEEFQEEIEYCLALLSIVFKKGEPVEDR